MTKKAILLTFISALGVVVLAGVLSYVVWTSQPSADSLPPTPPDPSGIPTDKPPVPPIPRLSGDVLDDGIVSALDINSLVVHWKQVADEYNLVDASGEQIGLITSLDLSQTIKYWKCVEQKGTDSCPYLASSNNSDGDGSIVPPTPPVPGSSSTDTSSTPVASATASASSDMPPAPPGPTNPS